MEDFAKIVRASNGSQVLFYIGPEGNDWILNQVVSVEEGQVNFTLKFTIDDADTNHQNALIRFSACDVEKADQLIESVNELIEAAKQGAENE